MISIQVNNQEKEVNEGISLESLVTVLKQNKNGIAIAINNEVIPKQKWFETILKGDDNVLIIQATQGG